MASQWKQRLLLTNVVGNDDFKYGSEENRLLR